jgi:dTDP-4-amino-4,6-dideoxygalactose transaminase
LEKLAILDAELGSRRELAAGYAAALADTVEAPSVIDGAVPAWAHYTVKVDDRERLVATLADAGIPTAVYYPKPLHLQPPFQRYPRAPGGCPVAERLAGTVVSLPMHPYLDAAARAAIIDAIRSASPRHDRKML